jgi:hypothetical protein
VLNIRNALLLVFLALLARRLLSPSATDT